MVLNSFCSYHHQSSRSSNKTYVICCESRVENRRRAMHPSIHPLMHVLWNMQMSELWGCNVQFSPISPDIYFADHIKRQAVGQESKKEWQIRGHNHQHPSTPTPNGEFFLIPIFSSSCNNVTRNYDASEFEYDRRIFGHAKFDSFCESRAFLRLYFELFRGSSYGLTHSDFSSTD